MYLKMGISGLVYVLVWLTSFYFYISFSKYLILILLSPILSLLSEKVEEIETGKEYDFKIEYFLEDVWRGVKISIKNFVLETTVVLLCFIVTFFIPILIPLTSTVTFYFSSYFVGVAFMDYNLERRRFSIEDSNRFMKKYSFAVIANGFWFNLLFYIPIVNIVIAPLVAVIGASLTVEELLKPFAVHNDKLQR